MSFFEQAAVEAARRLNEASDALLAISEEPPISTVLIPKAPKPRVPYNERPVPRGQVRLDRKLVEGEWVRASRYSEGHKVARDLRTAICGRPLDLHLHAWVVADTRKTGKCAVCRSFKDHTDVPSEAFYELVIASQTSRLPTSREGRKGALVFESKVALVKRYLGATEVS